MSIFPTLYIYKKYKVAEFVRTSQAQLKPIERFSVAPTQSWFFSIMII